MYGYIYKITNIINNKIYVGQTTKTIDERFYHHCKRTGKWISAIDSAIKKYGEENFILELLDTADTHEELNKKEIYWIEKLDSTTSGNGYNISKGGGQPAPTSQSTEANEKRSKSLKEAYATGRKKRSMLGKKHTPEARAKISRSQLGTHQSEETKRKISEAQKGKANHIQTAEEIAKRSMANTGKEFYHHDDLKFNALVTVAFIDIFTSQGWVKGRNYDYPKITKPELIKRGLLRV